MKFCRQNGFNLLELMLALVIVTSILLTTGHYYQVTKENTRVAQAAQLINQLLDASFRYLELKPDQLKQDILPALVEMDLLPKGFKDGARLSPWSTAVSISYKKASQPSLEFLIQNVPSKSCQSLVNLMNQSSKDSSSSHTFSCTLGGEENSERNFKGEIELKGIS